MNENYRHFVALWPGMASVVNIPWPLLYLPIRLTKTHILSYHSFGLLIYIFVQLSTFFPACQKMLKTSQKFLSLLSIFQEEHQREARDIGGLRFLRVIGGSQKRYRRRFIRYPGVRISSLPSQFPSSQPHDVKFI